MRSPFTTLLPLAFGASLLVGCGASELEERQGAEYPEVGYDAPLTQVASSNTQTPSPVPTAPARVPSSDEEMVPGSTTEAEAQAAAMQPQQGDIQVGADASEQGEYGDTDPSALSDFRAPLEPYGTWAEDGTYGTVWTPSSSVVGGDFAPYVSSGHWTYDDQYTWVSDYDWGWAPFHYGRWVYIGARGWSWIPGRTYAGAWVTWRTGYDGYGYLGWAPLPPTWYWHGGYAVGIGVVPQAPYVFCGYRDVFHPAVATRVVTGGQVAVVAGHTRPYVPAQPSVGGAGHVAAHPSVGGPPPASIGLNRDAIPRTPATDRGVMHAQQYAHPNTAQAMGAHAPVQMGQQHAMNGVQTAGPRAFAGPRAMPQSSGMVSSYGHNAAVATAPRYQGVAPRPYYPPAYAGPRASSYGSSYAAPRSSYGAYGSYSTPHYSPSYSAPHYATPYSAPHYGSAYGAYSAPHYASPSPSYGGGYHPGVAPSGGSSSSSSSSSSSYGQSYAAPRVGGSRGGGFRSGGASGGFHGGGFHGGGGRR